MWGDMGVGFSEVLAGGCSPAGQPWGQGAANVDLGPPVSPREEKPMLCLLACFYHREDGYLS